MKVELIDRMGSDLTVVNAARVSFDKESEWEQVCCGVGIQEGFSAPECCGIPDLTLSEKDSKLIRYLAKHNHFTPFTHPQITLRETVPIFVARQRFKHVVGFTYNEVSRRYVDDEPEFFTPEVWRSRPEGSVKQGSGEGKVKKILIMNAVESFECDLENAYQLHCEEALNFYKAILKAGGAPEQARMVLPQSMYTSYYVTGSLAAFARFYKQRIDVHAQKEIQELAERVGEIIAPMFPVSWRSLVEE